MAEEKIKWIWVQSVIVSYNGFNEYVSEDGKWCKQEWLDGYVEIFEIAT